MQRLQKVGTSPVRLGAAVGAMERLPPEERADLHQLVQSQYELEKEKQARTITLMRTDELPPSRKHRVPGQVTHGLDEHRQNQTNAKLALFEKLKIARFGSQSDLGNRGVPHIYPEVHFSEDLHPERPKPKFATQYVQEKYYPKNPFTVFDASKSSSKSHLKEGGNELPSEGDHA